MDFTHSDHVVVTRNNYFDIMFCYFTLFLVFDTKMQTVECLVALYILFAFGTWLSKTGILRSWRKIWSHFEAVLFAFCRLFVIVNGEFNLC